MKRITTFVFASLLTVIMTVSAIAADALVTFRGHDKLIDFHPGSVYSVTDLFDNFKDVMPGDVIEQKISLKHSGDRRFYAKIYMRSLGGTVGNDFLSKLHLGVSSQSKDLFDAPADKTDGLTDWTYIATLTKGEWVDLDVTLTVPTDLDNSFQFKEGQVEWEFMVEEIPRSYIPVTPAVGRDYVKYRVEAVYYTDNVADGEAPLPLYYNAKAESLPALEEIVERYSNRTTYGENTYSYTSTVFDSETNTFTLRFDRTTPEIPPQEPTYIRYTVEAKYYTNGILDIYVPVFASGDVESIPDETEITALYSDLTTVNELEYKFTAIEFVEETNTFTLRFDRTSEEKPDPTPPTGDNTKLPLLVGLLAGVLVILVLLIILSKKKKDENK